MNSVPIKKTLNIPRIPRFFLPNIPKYLLKVGLVEIPKNIAHHMCVLRLKQGDTVQLFNGCSVVWQGIVVELCNNYAKVDLQTPVDEDFMVELPFSITVAQSLIEPNKMDWVIEKTVELGAVSCQPIAASRSVTRLDTERAAKRLIHWQAIAVAASEQCGRNRVMQINTPLSLSMALKRFDNLQSSNTIKMTHLLLHPEDGISLQSWCTNQSPHPVVLWVGPEGGWSDAELLQLEAVGSQRITFGKRIFRTETAAIAVSAAIQALWTD